MYPTISSAQTLDEIIDTGGFEIAPLPDEAFSDLNGVEQSSGTAAAQPDNEVSESSSLNPSNKRAGDNKFFDSDDMVPQGQMGKQGPIRVNPIYQPGQKMVYVDRSARAGEKNSAIVAADRALALNLNESAFQLIEDLYRKSPKDPAILTRRAIALQKLGRFDEAMQTYEVLTDIDPDNINAQVNMLGLLSTRYPEIALRRLRDLYSLNRDNVSLIGQIAIVSAKAGDSENAIRYLGMAATMDPKNASHLFNMAVIADREGDSKTAINYYEKALEVDTIHGSSRSIPREAVYDRLAQIR